MALTSTASLPAPVDRVVALFCSEDFVRQVSEAAGGTLVSYQLTGELSGAFETQAARSVPSDRLPDFARKFVGATLTMNQQESWSAPAADGSRTVSITARISGAPVEASIVQTLTADGAQTTIEMQGTVSSNIPFFGEKIASAAEPAIGKALNLQVSEARKVLDA
ncbi:DUF2505 domain-containing protein [Arthrobacter russicus]|jgi:hypothetical protein|uniref:DUF2505 domain-containing protein n=1 Tax=Arthrobacter russicus TaxID=172040 RepID=A0ABU1J9A4_9MICC|nr:DUF2505 domain-containing protein [Arthrobacter russicus]MBQ1444336.1 DUF2505 domain-containing protein [Renibacterium sp.]MDN5669167.1 DUF2505 domain-containing protein [Renibacterium salmoninarum]MDR6269007.1 hypothetical protein [Arthrobacter russicus]